MRASVKHQIWIVAVAACVMFVNLGACELWDEDEPRNSACAREMMERGDWIVPTFNHELRPHKPVLLYWLMIGAYSVFGVNEFAARFASAALAVGTALATYHIGRRLFTAAVGLQAAIVVATSLMFVVAGRAATPDSVLIFCVTAAMALFVQFVPAERWTRSGGPGTSSAGPETSSANRPPWLPTAWWQFAAMYSMLGLAALAKGPIGVALPVGVIGLFLLCAWQRRAAGMFATKFFRCAWSMRPLTLAIVVLAVAGPWYLAVSLRTDGAWPAGFFGQHNVGRFVSAMEGHRGGVWYYVPAVLVGFFPWSIFLPLSLWRLVTSIRRGEADRSGAWLLVCWIGLWVGLFSVAGTKLPSYVTPIYPALAIATASFLEAWRRDPATVRPLWMVTAFGTLAVVGLGMVFGLPIATRAILPGEWALGLVGLVLIAGGGACLAFRQHGRPAGAVLATGVTAAAFCIGMFGLAAVRVNRYQNSASLVAAARRVEPAAPIATYEHASSSVVYYAQTPVSQFLDRRDVERYFRETPGGFLITSGERLDELLPHLPRDVTVLARQRRFLKTDDVLLLGRPTATASADSLDRR